MRADIVVRARHYDTEKGCRIGRKLTRKLGKVTVLRLDAKLRYATVLDI